MGAAREETPKLRSSNSTRPQAVKQRPYLRMWSQWCIATRSLKGRACQKLTQLLDLPVLELRTS
jgi:hypothetical protein